MHAGLRRNPSANNAVLRAKVRRADRWLALRVWPTLSSVEYTEDRNRGCLDVVDDEVRGSDDELARTGNSCERADGLRLAQERTA